MVQYLPVVVLAVLAVVFVLLSIAASRLLAPQRATAEKIAPYECGITDQAALPERYPVRFYLVAMLFIMFDIEIVFLYPWAVANVQLGLFGFLAMSVFVVIFFLSFVYELAMGGLEWGPVRRAFTGRNMAGTGSNVASQELARPKPDFGVRQVGLEGRLHTSAINMSPSTETTGAETTADTEVAA